MKITKFWDTNCYQLNDYYGTTNFWFFKDSNWDYYKIHIENHSKNDFSKEFKIKNDKDNRYYYNIQKTYITGQIENIIKDIEKQDSVWVLFIHKLVDLMR